MFRFLLKRLALTIPTFLALMFITFVMIRLVPGDPVEARRGERRQKEGLGLTDGTAPEKEEDRHQAAAGNR